MEIGQVIIKLAGRDAGKVGIIAEVIDSNYVLIDGNVRKRKCNIDHLYLTEKIAKIKKGATSLEVKKALKDLGYKVNEKAKKEKAKKEKPVKKRTTKPAKINPEKAKRAIKNVKK